MGYFDSMNIFILIIQINNFRSDLSSISAETATLVNVTLDFSCARCFAIDWLLNRAAINQVLYVLDALAPYSRTQCFLFSRNIG